MDSSGIPEKDIEANKKEPVLQKRLLTPFLSKKIPPIPKEEDKKEYAEHHANIISQMFFWWLVPTMSVGYKRTIEDTDLFKLTEKMTNKVNYEKFEANLAKIVERNKAKQLKLNPALTPEELENLPYPKLSIIEALARTYKWQYGWAILCKVLSDVSLSLNPLLTKALVNFVEKKTYVPSTPVGRGIGYAIGCSFLLAVNGILVNHFLYNSLSVGYKSKTVLITALLNKSLTANAETKHKYPNGKITSLMGTDLQRIDLAIGFQPFAITVIVPIAICIALLIVNIGVSALAGIAVFMVSLVLIGSAAKPLVKFRKSANTFTDKRVSLMREVLSNMKMIKFYAWEDAYEKNATEIRKREVKIIFQMQIVRNFMIAYGISLPSFTSMVAFLVLYGVKTNSSVADIFSSVSLFSTLSTQVLMLPMALATGADAWIGISRVRDYLQSPSLKEDELEMNYFSENLDPNIAIKVENATFKWERFEDEEETKDEKEKEKEPPIADEIISPDIDHDISEQKSSSSLSSSQDQDLEKTDSTTTNKGFKGFENINLEIKAGEFVIITGPIGCGKSSLLNAIAGFMKKQSGSLEYSKSLLLCGQPWVQNATIKENIIFGSEFDETKYNKVLNVCSLTDDLKMFPAGDLTEVGERGITLSGGQKARLNLARAVYADKEIILLDDVLSAVDAKVGKHIMEECFVGYLRNKTRVLATHQLSLINQADRVIFLNGDGKINIGTYQELAEILPEFKTLMEFSSSSKSDDDEENFVEQQLEEEEIKEEKRELESGVLMREEEKAVNQISFSIYLDYIREGSGIFKQFAVPLVLMFLVFDIFTSLFSNVWLSFWVSEKFKGRSSGFYIGLYVMFVLLSIIFMATEFMIMCYMSITAARKLNIGAVKRVFHTPLSYIDTTPIGRILNRFTKDTDAVDNEIGEQIRLFLHPVASVFGILILCIVYLPWFAIAIPPLFIAFMAIASFYQASSREVKRLEAVKRSFVYTNFSEVLSGLDTIKAYRAESRFLIKNDRFIDGMNEASFLVIANQRWLGIFLDMVACAVALIISILAATRQFHISAASAGLLISYILQLAGLLSLIMRAYTQVENEMNSVERLCFYANELEQEAPYQISETAPPPEWPSEGVIKFENASLSYRPGLPLVLKNLNLTTTKNEKIGICGRTGAGKSTIMTALYRLSELASGRILIDGIDISKIGLLDLRSKLSIIPQDPVLFKGTLRKNLDPFDQHEDDLLWDCLRKAGLIKLEELEKVKKQVGDTKDMHKFHMSQQVEDEGSNFSLGERQLMALARALVRNSKILILDEATSSVDYETDSKIQSTIANEFSDCTILCIAHRLKTILDYDRILVLEKGEIVQFGKPIELFNQQGGIFRSMCEKSSIVRSDFKRV